MVNSCSNVFAKPFLRKTLIFVQALSGQVMTVEAQELFSFYSDQISLGENSKRLEMTFSTNQVRGVAEYDVLNEKHLVTTRLVGESLCPEDDLPTLYDLQIQEYILSRTNLFEKLSNSRTYHTRTQGNEIRLDIWRRFSTMIYGDSTTNDAVTHLNTYIEDTIHWLRNQYPERAQCVTQYFERATMPARETTISQILQDPSAYHGKRIRISGYYKSEMECSSFSEPYPDDIQSNPTDPLDHLRKYKHALWLGGLMTISELEESKIDAISKVFQEATNARTRIWIEGVLITDQIHSDIYDTKSKGVGHLGLWSAAIDDISDAGFVLDVPRRSPLIRWIYSGVLLFALHVGFRFTQRLFQKNQRRICT